MKRAKFLIFGLFLALGVTAAVTTLVAQTTTRERVDRPRLMMLDGRGAQLGVSVSDLQGEDLKGATAGGGVRIDDVDEGSAAAKAGLREGDIVVEYDGERVRSARQFARLVQESPDGRAVKVAVVRGGQRQTLDVTPASRAFGWGVDGDRIGRDIARSMRELEPRMREFRWDAPGLDVFEFPGLMTPRTRLGVQIEELNPQLAQYFGAKDGGVLVSSVNENSAAQKAGLRAGDVITSINGKRVGNYNDLRDNLRDLDGEITVGIIRDKKETTVKATVEDTRLRTRRIGRPI